VENARKLWSKDSQNLLREQRGEESSGNQKDPIKIIGKRGRNARGERKRKGPHLQRGKSTVEKEVSNNSRAPKRASREKSLQGKRAETRTNHRVKGTGKKSQRQGAGN